MIGSRFRVARFLGALVLVLGLSAMTYAMTAANTVPASKAGDGQAAITGYVVSSVHYALNATNPSLIDGVTFSLDSAPVAGSTIRIQITAAGTWFSCTNAAAAVTCTTTGAGQPTVLAATSLRVIVAD